jgi:hypothetical protein
MGTAAKVLFTGGVYQPAWRSERYDPVRSPSVGRYSARGFNPDKWKGNFSLVAFEEMTTADAFWAAQIIATFTPEQIRAAVELGEFSDPADAEYLTKGIIQRQRIIVDKYARERAGLANFRVERTGDTDVLTFTDYRLIYNNEQALMKFSGYSYQLRATGRTPQLLAEGKLAEPRLMLAPEALHNIRQSGTSDAERGVAELVIGQAGEQQKARLYLYAAEDGSVRIVGVRL